MFLTKVLKEKTSKYNGDVRVLNTFGSGIYIQSNGLTQSGGIVKTIWKKAIKNLISQGADIKSCLILGLGGGTVSGLVREFWPNAEITGVDIDQIIVDFGLEFMNLGEQDINIVVGDANNYIKGLIRKKQKFDLVIVDLYKGDVLPKQFDSYDFIGNISKVTENRGYSIFNRLSFGDKKILLDNFELKVKKVFNKVDKVTPIANVLFVCKHNA